MENTIMKVTTRENETSILEVRMEILRKKMRHIRILLRTTWGCVKGKNIFYNYG